MTTNKNVRIRLFITIILLILFSGIMLFTVLYFVRYWKNNPPSRSVIVKQNVEEQLVSYYKFDDVQSGITDDNSSNKNNAVLESYLGLKLFYGVPSNVKGKDNNALHFDGKSWVSGNNLDLYNTDKFTILLWVWMAENQISKVPTIIAKSNWSSYNGWWLCTKSGTRFIDMGIAWGESLKHIGSGYELPVNEWHHIAVTMDNVKNEVQFFIDGLPYGDKHINVPKWLICWNYDLFIGDYDGSGRWPWVGKLDEVRYYNKILTSKNIHSIFLDENIEN